MSFLAFKYTDLVQGEWDTSSMRALLAESRFLFVIFKNTKYGYVLHDAFFWGMPAADLEEHKNIWTRTVDVINTGVVLTIRKERTFNNFLKESPSFIGHVCPKGRDSKDCYEFPDGRMMTKQCF